MESSEIPKRGHASLCQPYSLTISGGSTSDQHTVVFMPQLRGERSDAVLRTAMPGNDELTFPSS
jgi:hypothetical protein